jgi:hypothetical protein
LGSARRSAQALGPLAGGAIAQLYGAAVAFTVLALATLLVCVPVTGWVALVGRPAFAARQEEGVRTEMG